jgi:hypothetical protein
MGEWQQFAASLVGSLAWPAAVLVLAWMFRGPLARLLSGDIKRWKAGPSGLEVEYWDASLAEAKVEITGERPPLPAGSTAMTDRSGSFRAEMAELAAISPRSAVMESFRRVEIQLRNLLEGAGVEQLRPTGARMLVETAARHELISPEAADAVRRMSTLRNLAAHGHDDDGIDEERALGFVDLAESVMWVLELSSPGDG